MSLITRCPACTTLFKVVPDQLRVSEGWVRCGQCDEVFDANAHLQGDVQAPLPPAPWPVVQTPAAPTPSVYSPVAQPDLALANMAEQSSAAELEPGADTETHLPDEPGPQREHELAAKLVWPEAPDGPDALDAPVPNYDSLMAARPGSAFHSGPALHLEMPGEVSATQAGDADVVTDPVIVEPYWEDSPPLAHAEPSVAAASEEVSVVYAPPTGPAVASTPAPALTHMPMFMRAPRKASPWSKPWARRSLSVLALLLVATLGAQATLHERDRLAASVPDVRPTLSAMCEALGCLIQPFKKIDAVVIEASSFVKVRGDIYRLNLTLKNTAPIDIAAPAIELTLTDTQDQPMIRHVFAATDLGAQKDTLAAGAELTAAVPLNVKTGGAERISGYRLLAFYP